VATTDGISVASDGTDVRFTGTVTSADPPLSDLIWLYATVRAARTTFATFHFTCRPPPTGRVVFIGTDGLSTRAICTSSASTGRRKAASFMVRIRTGASS
jgi:hypothetical protein